MIINVGNRVTIPGRRGSELTGGEGTVTRILTDDNGKPSEPAIIVEYCSMFGRKRYGAFFSSEVRLKKNETKEG